MIHQDDTVITTNDGPPADAVAAAVLAAQMRIIDVAVRNARTAGWCEEFERIMGQLFPEGPPDGSREFVDSDGLSCRGYDRDGYDRNGLDRGGWNRDGYDRRGYDRDGYDRDGWDHTGYNRDGYNRDGYDVDGFNADGFTREGVHRDSPEYRLRFRYDAQGYDRDGYDHGGYSRWGRTREQEQARGGVYRYDERGHPYNNSFNN
jgi:hypothetical protein